MLSEKTKGGKGGKRYISADLNDRERALIRGSRNLAQD